MKKTIFFAILGIIFFSFFGSSFNSFLPKSQIVQDSCHPDPPTGGEGSLSSFAFARDSSPSAQNDKLIQNDKKCLTKVKVGGTVFNVEIPKTQAESELGLAKYKTLAQDAGMLFVLPQKSKPAMWMKGMVFPIDIIWIADNKVIGFEENVSVVKEGVLDSQIPRYSPEVPIDYVLEISSGGVKKSNIEVGDKVEILK